MSRMVIRPPAARFPVIPQQGPLTRSQQAPSQTQVPGGDAAIPERDLGRQTFGAVDSPKRYGGAQAGNIDFRTMFQYVWQDRVQVNPAHEQPRLIFYSGAQPLIRWGMLRRFTRTFMAASPRFQGRWLYVGFIQRHYTERARMTGMPSRRGTTYVSPVFVNPTRGVQLGRGAQGG